LPKQLRLEVAELTDVGRRRDSNEDNMTRLVPKEPKLLEQKGALFVVADGMGGHAAGEVASEIAVETIREEYYETEQEDIPEALATAIKQANQVIYDRATEQSAGRAGMGTTCVVAVVRGALVYLANVGDSRAYLVRDGQICQLTYDHSWVAEQVRAGMLTEEQARTHSHRNVITRALGTQAEVQPDLFIVPLEEGDLLLLCSDGLSGYVSDEEMNRILNSTSPVEGVHALIDQANEHGGPDNITAVLVHALEVPPLPPEERERIAALAEAHNAAQVAPKADATRAKKKLTPIQWAMRLFSVVALLFLGLLALDYTVGPLAWQRTAQNQLNADLNQAKTLVVQAQDQDATQAINTLAAAQHPLLRDVTNTRLSSADRQRPAMPCKDC
jgi:serine/threonine protein phosphatase PrpC